MSYANQADIEDLYGFDLLVRVADPNKTGAPDADLIAQGLQGADDIINAYLSAQYPVPLSPVPGSIRSMAVDIALYRMAIKRAMRTDEMRQRYDIRACLDELAARLAAQQATSSPAAARIASRGNAILKAGRAAVAAGDLSAMVSEDVAFHTFIYEVSGNPLLGPTAELHWHYLRRVMGEVLRHAAPGPSIWQQHEAILAAILDGDAGRAGRLAAEHVHGAANRLAEDFSTRHDPAHRSIAS